MVHYRVCSALRHRFGVFDVFFVNIVVILLLMLPLTVFGAGFHFPDQGTEAMSRAGAFVAKSDNPMAIYYNPAGLTQLDGTHVYLGGTLSIERHSFQRLNYLAATPEAYAHDAAFVMPRITNTDGPGGIPSLIVSSDLAGLLKPIHLRVAAGLLAPMGTMSRTFPTRCTPGVADCDSSLQPVALPNPGRYDLNSRRLLVAYPTFGAAWEPLKGLSIGAVLQLNYLDIKYAMTATADPGGTENPFADIDATYKGKSNISPTGIIGLMWRALPYVSVGASVRPGYTFKTEGTMALDIPAGLAAAQQVTADSPFDATLNIPKATMVRAGARYIYLDDQSREKFDIEIDFVWENTSVVNDLIVKSDISIGMGGQPGAITLSEVNIPYRWKDAYSVRLGGSYNFFDAVDGGDLSVRAGALYESQVAPNAYMRNAFSPLARYGLNLGAGYQINNWSFNVAYGLLMHKSVTVKPAEGVSSCLPGVSGDCGAKTTSVAPGAPENSGAPVGNGTYDATIHLLSASVSIAFGAGS